MTSPVIRCVKEQLKSDVHFLTKTKYKTLLEYNIHLDKLYHFEKEWEDVKEELIAEEYSLVIDLHKTVRSIRLRSIFSCPVISFNKATIEKWMFLNLRINKLPDNHLIDQFFKGLKDIKVLNDGKGMELFVDVDTENRMMRILENHNIRNSYTVIVVGGAHLTKQIPMELAIDYINKTTEPIVLVGGPEEIEKSKKIVEFSNRFINNMVGHYSLLESAILVRESNLVITGDTGMMHMAASYNKKIVAIYGSTSPVFGMYPYLTDTEKKPLYMLNDHLSCWPCSKSGRSKCPKEHMNCLRDWKGNDIVNLINRQSIRN